MHIAEVKCHLAGLSQGREARLDVSQHHARHPQWHERPGLDLPCARRSRNRERLFAQGHSFDGPVTPGVESPESREDERAGSRRWLRGDQPDRLLVRGQGGRLVEGRGTVLTEPFVEQPGPRRVGRGIDQPDGLPDVGDRAGRLRAFGVERSPRQELDAVERGARSCVGDLVPQLERVLEVSRASAEA